MPKKSIEEVDEVIDEVTEVKETPIEVVPDSPEKAKYRRIIEEYKVQNPWKYEMKKEAMERKLNSL